jgi:hypothetical protein
MRFCFPQCFPATNDQQQIAPTPTFVLFSYFSRFLPAPAAEQLAAVSFPTPFGLHSFLHEQLA